MGIAITLKQYLNSHNIEYSEYPHHHTASALESAVAAHIESDLVVKAILMTDGKKYLLAALPADRRLEIDRLCDYMNQDYELATEDEIAEVFADCELGAIPPAGDAYGLNVIWDDSLSEPDGVYLEAGDHETLLRIEKKDFLRLMGDANHTVISQPAATW